MGEEGDPTSDVDQKVRQAKAYLEKQSEKYPASQTLFAQLTNVVKEILKERPTNSIDILEQYVKRINIKDDSTQPTDEIDSDITEAEAEIKLFQRDTDGDGEAAEAEEDFDIPLPDMMELAYYFEQAGFGLGRQDMHRISLALRQLAVSLPLSSVRFWGKIIGTNADYIIAEAEYRDGEEEEQTQEEEAPEEKEEETPETGEDGDPVEEDNIPQSSWKPPTEIPAEMHRNGTNKKVFFVCNKVGGEWTKLPHVTPAQIAVARQIKKFLTGNLEAPVVSYPPFPGNESNYLRAQIARISAGCQISPAGYFTFEDEEEEEEEEEGRNSYSANPDFDGLTLRELVDANMGNWVHHTQSILPQGRCTWFNPVQKPEDDFEDDDLDEDVEEEDDSAQPEIGPPLLASVAEDEGLGDIPAWSVMLSSKLLPEYALVVARSNHWPGAVAFAKGKKFENIYIGFGHKYKRTNYTPPAPPVAMDEFPVDESVEEMDDPTVEEETALKQAQDEARREAQGMDDDDDDGEDDD